jgi:hypothetical protein
MFETIRVKSLHYEDLSAINVGDEFLCLSQEEFNHSGRDYLKFGRCYPVIHIRIFNELDPPTYYFHLLDEDNDIDDTYSISMEDLFEGLICPIKLLTEEEQFLLKLGANIDIIHE